MVIGGGTFKGGLSESSDKDSDDSSFGIET